MGPVDYVAESLGKVHTISGFAQTEVDYKGKRVILRWKGDPPEEVSKLAAQSATDGVEVVIERVPYSRAELVAASEEAIQFGNGTYGPMTIVLAGPNASYTGIDVSVNKDSKVSRADVAAGLDRAVTSVPVEVGTSAAPALASRQDDHAPWYGGSAIGDYNGRTYCSTGFAVKETSGAGKLLSAGHCVVNNPAGANNEFIGWGRVLYDGIPDEIMAGDGQWNVEGTGVDSMLIYPRLNGETLRTRDRVYAGAWTSNTSRKVGAASLQEPPMSANICTSGAVTGEHCGLVVNRDIVSFPCFGTENLARTCWGFEALTTGVAAGRGDSGGPVYSIGGSGNVLARGIITAIATAPEVLLEPCGATAEPTTCSNVVYVTFLHTTLDRWNVTLQID